MAPEQMPWMGDNAGCFVRRRPCALAAKSSRARDGGKW
jgi:hypothetical protein